MRLVVAIGGNALSAPGESGDIHDQFAHSRALARPLADLVERGWHLVITHGNGPQVGSIMQRVEIAEPYVYPIDLGLAVADTQAGMGYMLAQTLRNELHHRGLDRDCTTIVTTVLVDPRDPAFDRPTKPIGPFMDEATAMAHRDAEGWTVVEDAGRGWRRAVPSPRPLRIVEAGILRRLVDGGEMIVAAGGGGVPIIENEIGEYHGVEAVIDKDATAVLLAEAVAAETLAIVTGVACVYANFGRPDQTALRSIRADEAEHMAAAGQFAAGSMLPKMQAAVDFVRGSALASPRAVITDWQHVSAALDGTTGTSITR